MSDLPMPPPIGSPSGPSVPTEELVERFLDGSGSGSSPDARVEGSLLLAGHEPVAIRLDGAVLVRDHVPDTAAVVRAALCEALTSAGLQCVEHDTALAPIVEAEVFARRAHRWGLWASDLDRGLAVLSERAVGDIPGVLETARERRQRQGRIDAVIRELEDDL